LTDMAIPQTVLPTRLATLLRNFSLKSACRYAVVGLLQNGISYCFLLLLISFGWLAWQAILVLTPIAMIVSYLANRSWTFEGSGKNPRQFIKYVATYAVSYLGAVSLTWAQEAAGVSSWAAALITTVTAAFALFLVLNFWIFPNRLTER